ncbi:MAG: Pili biogenesis protein ATPase [Candidatus Azambacteria bacterium GW2011_GWB1_42_17]|uniref:Pili biogenesis protein ATPase n=1 Tax=Candidatus Azambacteria bacterium GW2011_GWB1_42_17 TaxID=1618615 RepID=A0A0G1C597_9BACT|nr:MAG: Pili biogenesis protein ATPase [Candidatus Azambacteria bacterium GW2011_GWB1_42_17]KKS88796.1 MAG: Pili biogenesis protein ATPase [Parcubacteria group bacterium GW2011_GWC1_43_11]
MPTIQQELEDLLLNTLSINASDLHLSVGYKPTARVDGALLPLNEFAVLTPEHAKDLAYLLLGDHKDEFLLRKEMDFSYSFRDKARFRINVFFEKGFISTALRIIPSRINTLEELNLPSIFHRLTKLEQGFVLVTGPSGHGKSTTLASLIDEINRSRSEHIITIEDPIEYLFIGNKSLVNQREVGRDTKNFHNALSSLLREDPNIIMIGEMRDPETISAALTAAETGHLVFSSLHTNSASQTVDRIIDVFPSQQQNQIRLQLANTLSATISQRLLPRISGGRLPAAEIMFVNGAISNLIRENKAHQIDLVIETSLESGMISLNRSLAELVRRGEVAAEVAMAYALNPIELQTMIGYNK